MTEKIGGKRFITLSAFAVLRFSKRRKASQLKVKWEHPRLLLQPPQISQIFSQPCGRSIELQKEQYKHLVLAACNKVPLCVLCSGGHI